MAGFYGYRSAIESLRLHMHGTGKITTGTLLKRGVNDAATNVDWGNVYVWPQDMHTGLDAQGYPTIHGQITMWRTGETTAPYVDDKLTVGSVTYLIANVSPERNADESSNFAVYQCSVTSNPTPRE